MLSFDDALVHLPSATKIPFGSRFHGTREVSSCLPAMMMLPQYMRIIAPCPCSLYTCQATFVRFHCVYERANMSRYCTSIGTGRRGTETVYVYTQIYIERERERERPNQTDAKLTERFTRIKTTNISICSPVALAHTRHALETYLDEAEAAVRRRLHHRVSHS